MMETRSCELDGRETERSSAQKRKSYTRPQVRRPTLDRRG
jgi:hypothetical protein